MFSIINLPKQDYQKFSRPNSWENHIKTFAKTFGVIIPETAALLKMPLQPKKERFDKCRIKNN